jgi:hypothetical protein
MRGVARVGSEKRRVARLSELKDDLLVRLHSRKQCKMVTSKTSMRSVKAVGAILGDPQRPDSSIAAMPQQPPERDRQDRVSVLWTDPPYNVSYQDAAGSIPHDNMKPGALPGLSHRRLPILRRGDGARCSTSLKPTRRGWPSGRQSRSWGRSSRPASSGARTPSFWAAGIITGGMSPSVRVEAGQLAPRRRAQEPDHRLGDRPAQAQRRASEDEACAPHRACHPELD